MSGLMDYPNREALGLDPPWVESNEGVAGTPTAKAAATTTDTENDLDGMTKAEMLERAKELGVSPANNDMTKEELRAGIDAKLTEG